jgi:hypothetical protein
MTLADFAKQHANALTAAVICLGFIYFYAVVKKNNVFAGVFTAACVVALLQVPWHRVF